MQYNAVQCSAMQCNAMPWSLVPYNVMESDPHWEYPHDLPTILTTPTHTPCVPQTLCKQQSPVRRRTRYSNRWTWLSLLIRVWGFSHTMLSKRHSHQTPQIIFLKTIPTWTIDFHNTYGLSRIQTIYFVQILFGNLTQRRVPVLRCYNSSFVIPLF